MQLKLDPTITYAIALEGGGAKGAYEIGVWKALREAGIKFDAVAGTSVGALNGAMYAIGDFDKAVDFLYASLAGDMACDAPSADSVALESLNTSFGRLRSFLSNAT